MRPLPYGSGKSFHGSSNICALLCFNEAAPLRKRKVRTQVQTVGLDRLASMRPLPYGSGKGQVSDRGAHTIYSASMRPLPYGSGKTRPRTYSYRCGGFNEAAPLRKRKGGHRRAPLPGGVAASMRPLPYGSGKFTIAPPCVRSRNGFNEAAPLRKRKELW